MFHRSRCIAALGAAFLLVGAYVVSFVRAEGDEKQTATPKPSAEEMQKMMQRWQATMQPGPAHAKLEPLIGEWDTTTKMWWGGPGSQASESHGSAKNEWLLGKRFVLSQYNSEMKLPGPDGKEMTMPFEGVGVTGYDNYRKMYTSGWIDSMGTAMSISKGSIDPTGKVFRFYGEMDEPMLGVIGRYVKSETILVDADHYTFSIFDLHAGEDYKVLEVTYSRKK